MAFKASTKRERHIQSPIVGTVLNPSAAIRIWYQSQLYDIIESMAIDYQKEMGKALHKDDVKEFYAEDASASAILKETLKTLNKKWNHIFKGFAKSVSQKFVEKSDDYAKKSTQFSLSHAGIAQPRMTYNENIKNTLNASQDFNNTLITGLHEEAHERIYTAVMLSLTSPNPEEQGMSGIQAALKEVGGFSKSRAKLIATDQTSKVYSALSDERLAQNGVEKYEWMHSSAGKTPRQTHLDRDGKIYELNDPRVWEGPKADQGPPGWAINCRCRRRPIIIE